MGSPVYLNLCLDGRADRHLASLEQKGNVDEAMH